VTTVAGSVSSAAANALHAAVGAGSTTASGGAATGASTSTGSSGSTSSSSSGTGGTPASRPTPPPPSGLTSNEAYDVALAITNSAGGLDTIDPLERLHVIQDQQHHALLVELGVLQGGNRVLFAVEPTAAPSGPGTCTPGPLDCEVLSLAPEQIETLSEQTSTGPVTVAMFAVTGIKVAQYPSAAAAKKARAAVDATGAAVLNSSSLSALALFQYEPSLGAIVDLRNLAVGGG
jgi:hypothetical protein